MLAPHPSTARPMGGRRGRPRSIAGETNSTARRANGDTFVSESRPRRQRDALTSEQPWQSRAVGNLVSQARTRQEDGTPAKVQPMIVEGPRGTSLRAVGCQEDHQVAGDALGQILANRRRKDGQEILLPPPMETMDTEGGGGRRAAEAEDALGHVQTRGNRSRSDYIFGAVYEHTDSFGRPKVVGSTALTPEQQFLEDGRNHSAVSRLLTVEQGSSHVVWAGIGRRSAGVGEGEMAVIRESVVHERAKRMHIGKLGSIKPYSRHGF